MRKVLEYFTNLWYNFYRIGEVVIGMEKDKKISILTVANYVIYYLNRKGIKVSQLKLQKLLYFIEAYYMVCENSEMFDEEFKAYTYGPVAFSVYNYYKLFGGRPIDVYDPIDEETERALEPYIPAIKEVCDTFGKLETTQLVNLTHEDGSPWSFIWNRNGGKNSGPLGIIPKYLTSQWFKARFTDEN